MVNPDDPRFKQTTAPPPVTSAEHNQTYVEAPSQFTADVPPKFAAQVYLATGVSLLPRSSLTRLPKFLAVVGEKG